VYGFAHNEWKQVPRITKFAFDMKMTALLELYMSVIKPDILIHLAGISSAPRAYQLPQLAIETNGLIVANICDVIHRNGWKTRMFNASSSEIYKGHRDYLVMENDHHYNHIHPYSIAKIMGQSVVEFYRTEYGLPFFNGVIFTVESGKKTAEFLLSKVASHAATPNAGPLRVGPLNSMRQIIHPADVATAIQIICEQTVGDDYIVCANEPVSIGQLVTEIYKRNGIDIVQTENAWLNGASMQPVLLIEPATNGMDSQPTNIHSVPSKLLRLGWQPVYTVDAILDEIVSANR
jgi:GDPmannose 4,6-dehydratase